MSASLRALPAVVFFACLSIGCQRKEAAPLQAAALTPVPMAVNAKNEIATPPAAAPPKENTLDTSSADAPQLSSKTILPPPEQHKAFPKVNTPADERLPSWVPVTGRLTVVSSHDLAKNLGIPQQPAPAADAPASNLGALPPPRANPNEGGFVVRPVTPARASWSAPSRGRRTKKR